VRVVYYIITTAGMLGLWFAVDWLYGNVDRPFMLGATAGGIFMTALFYINKRLTPEGRFNRDAVKWYREFLAQKEWERSRRNEQLLISAAEQRARWPETFGPWQQGS
jgi:hypothetical protein